MIRRPPRSTLFPYTTLFRSEGPRGHEVVVLDLLVRRFVGAGVAVDDQEIGRAVQQECRDRFRMPSSAWNKTGQNLKGLCPFHQEKSTSFTVSPARQVFHCCGWGAGVNVFTFLMRITGVNFFLMIRGPPKSTLFPYPALFR